ncbi:BAR adaptor protein Hob3 [Tieghemiomyces parasiticus]|uniref:BAR adaptor protein Hob3 n=1 Tax=Tieghemiomyces parasiticus TaxID=78921 RepID=A0A9W8AC20_9FUNG|nr:BAR adaptor protein Hob3 [Tieghemiomyces parasiticus]
MSWSGFKKSVNRTGISLMQGFGAIEKTVDRDFQEKEANFKVLQTKSEELHKQAKAYIDAVKAMTAAQVQVAEHLEAFYDPQSPGGAYSAQYREAMAAIDGHTRAELEDTYLETVLHPVGRYCGYIPEFNAAISKRGRKLLDYDQAKTKLRKLEEKSGGGAGGATPHLEDDSRVAQAEQAAHQAKSAYEVLNQQLLDEIPQFINIRVPYMEPSFEAMLKSQLKFFEDSYTQLQQVGARLPPAASQPLNTIVGSGSGGELGLGGARSVEGGVGTPGSTAESFNPSADHGIEEQVDNVLQQMRELSICGMNVR